MICAALILFPVSHSSLQANYTSCSHQTFLCVLYAVAQGHAYHLVACGWGWPLCLGFFQFFCCNWSCNCTLINCVLASEELWVPVTFPWKNVGLIWGEVPHKSHPRPGASGCRLKWVLLAAFVLASRVPVCQEMDLLTGPWPSSLGRHGPSHSYGPQLTKSGISTSHLEGKELAVGQWRDWEQWLLSHCLSVWSLRDGGPSARCLHAHQARTWSRTHLLMVENSNPCSLFLYHLTWSKSEVSWDHVCYVVSWRGRCVPGR